ncbi:MAG: Crp/Fnr family transcriptional regulator [Chloroflexi bacterium]|nr:Crp/Fnr family transcriptional regulator [Chloroflexota bacterium]
MVGTDVLSGMPLFEGLASGALVALSNALQKRRYPKGDVIFHQDDPGSTMYIIIEGVVKIVVTSPDGKQHTLAILSRGAFFGEMSLLDAQPRSADAVALETCQLLTLGREQFVDFLRAQPEAALKLFAALCCRLRHADQLVQDAVFLDVPGRLARTILDLAESQGETESGGIAISPRFSQVEMAEMVGATRESINKWLGLYARMGLLRYEHGRITVLRPDKLRERIC